MTTLSLRHRLLLAAAAILVTFLGLAGFALDRAFVSSAEVSLRSQLRTQTFAMLSVLEVDSRGGIVLPRLLPEARLMVPNSGLYAFIINESTQLVWQSGSSIGVEVPPLSKEARGSEIFLRQGDSLSSPYRYSFSFAWETEVGVEHEFTLTMIESSDNFSNVVSEHRNKIILWLGLVGAFLLIALTLALRWSLAPLARVGQEIDLIERGRQEGISGTYPQEIAQLSERINLFIRNERSNLDRYRNTLADLAHSLKTPLAVMRGMSETGESVPANELGQYVTRMRNIVDYQLKRAASSRVSLVHTLVEVEPVISRVQDALKKVYAERNLDWQVSVSADLRFYGEESDLLEVVGNVMDNACKWARHRIVVRANALDEASSQNSGVRIEVEDDGPGIPSEERDAVLERGVRADEQVDGQGIGLAVCREIVGSYHGSLQIARSELGGASVTLEFHHPIGSAAHGRNR